MDDRQRPARVIFATGMISLGVIGLLFRAFASVWQPVPGWVPGREILAVVCAALTLAIGIGLLIDRTAPLTSRVLIVYLALWILLLKVPIVVRAPLVEASWLGLGEISVITAGGWILFATLSASTSTLAGARGVRRATMLFGLALLAIGLSHFVYAKETAALVPAWLPFRIDWAYFTGAAQIAAGLGVLFSVKARLAATLEAAILTVFTLLVWGPHVVAASAGRTQWTPLIMSWVITTGAWVVALNIGRNSEAQAAV